MFGEGKAPPEVDVDGESQRHEKPVTQRRRRDFLRHDRPEPEIEKFWMSGKSFGAVFGHVDVPMRDNKMRSFRRRCDTFIVRLETDLARSRISP